MSAIDEIFSEYVRMRENGLGAEEALRTLRNYVAPLSQDERSHLGKVLRGWENKRISPDSDAVTPTQIPDTSPLSDEAKRGEIWVACPHCQRKNRVKDVFCFSCGQLLEQIGRLDTRTFSNATKELHDDTYFGDDSMLILQVKGSQNRFEIRPQLRDSEIILGRSNEQLTIQPDIDLSGVNGAQLGVSRLHLVVTYDDTLELLKVNDLGSANGTKVNGQKIHPSEYRIIRNGDEITLGRLMLLVQYQHPGKEITGSFESPS